MKAKAILPLLITCLIHASVVSVCAADAPAKKIRAGMIGLDTSHVTAFTKMLNDPKAAGDLADISVVAAYPGGSPDLPASWDRVKEYTEKLRGMGVEIVDSIDELLERVHVVLLTSVDGRPHLAQARPVIAAGKPSTLTGSGGSESDDSITETVVSMMMRVGWNSSTPSPSKSARSPKLGSTKMRAS